MVRTSSHSTAAKTIGSSRMRQTETDTQRARGRERKRRNRASSLPFRAFSSLSIPKSSFFLPLLLASQVKVNDERRKDGIFRQISLLFRARERMNMFLARAVRPF